MSSLEQAESVGRGYASCSWSRGVGGGLYPVPLLHEEPLIGGGGVRQRRESGCAKIRATNEASTSLKR